MKRVETKELGRTCICMESWMLDGALLGTLGAGRSTAWNPGCWTGRGTANLNQGKTKSSDLSVRYAAPRVRRGQTVYFK